MKKILFGISILLSLNTYSHAISSTDSDYYGSCFPKEKSVTQSFVIDNKTKEAFGYNLKRISKESPSPGAVISTYPLKKGDMKYIDRSGPYEQLGHQGLALQYRQGVRYFWSSVGNSYGSDSGSYVARYRLDNGEIKEFTTFKLYQDNTQKNITPTVSQKQNYLIAKMSNKTSHEIRIFDLEQFEGVGNLSVKEKYAFQIPRDKVRDKGMAFQSMAGDSKFVYVLMGSSKVGQKNRIDVYSLSGNYVRAVEVHQGEEDAAAIGSGTHYEPEWLTWLNQDNRAQLMLSIAAGDSGDRRCIIYGTGIFAD
ncbi:MAG: hypothetical protein LBJ15_14800 [Comamonas sp.]|uniref:phage baseplate protein n=1 Tax=Comamonas sp. TaxID=34028 RepID=UPI00281F03C3|nr:hypothetical protein [Comamonas sp.]MDR0215259.1 hypothetical protein [Comamonas sp.]